MAKRPYTPSTFYEFREDFGYQSYLEEKSHFDTVNVRIDDQTSAILAGNKSVTQALSSTTDSVNSRLDSLGERLNSIDTGLMTINETLEDGFHDLKIGLNKIDSGIDNLNRNVIRGFENLFMLQSVANDRLGSLIDLLAGPDRTWANEKLRTARKQNRLGNYEEALHFAQIAIDGDKNNSGVFVEPVYHYFIGMVRSGETGARGDLIELETAKNAFISGARYSGTEDIALFTECLWRASWCAYCQGNFAEARRLVDRALEDDAAALKAEEPLLLSARYAVEEDDLAKTRKQLTRVFEQTPALVVRVSADEGFFPARRLIALAAEDARKALVSKLKTRVAGLDLEGLKDFNEHAKPTWKLNTMSADALTPTIYDDALDLTQTFDGITDTLPLIDARQLFDALPMLIGSLAHTTDAIDMTLRRHVEMIEQHIENKPDYEATAEGANVTPSFHFAAVPALTVIGGVIGGPYAVISDYRAGRLGNDPLAIGVNGFFEFIGGIIEGLIVGAIAGIGVAISLFCLSLVVAASDFSLTKRQDRLRYRSGLKSWKAVLGQFGKPVDAVLKDIRTTRRKLQAIHHWAEENAGRM